MGTAVRWALDEFKYTGVRACGSGGDDVFMCMNDVVVSATIVQCYDSLVALLEHCWRLRFCGGERRLKGVWIWPQHEGRREGGRKEEGRRRKGRQMKDGRSEDGGRKEGRQEGRRQEGRREEGGDNDRCERATLSANCRT